MTTVGRRPIQIVNIPPYVLDSSSSWIHGHCLCKSNLFPMIGRGWGPGGIFRHNKKSWTVMNVRIQSTLTSTVAGVMEATMEMRTSLRGDIVVEKTREVEVVEVGSQCGCRYVFSWWRGFAVEEWNFRHTPDGPNVHDYGASRLNLKGRLFQVYLTSAIRGGKSSDPFARVLNSELDSRVFKPE